VKNETKDQEQPKQEQNPKERDWFTRVKPLEKGQGQSDVSGTGQAGERWAGRIFGAGRER